MIFQEFLFYCGALLSALGGVVVLYTCLKAAYLFFLGILTGSLESAPIRMEMEKGIPLGLDFMIGASIIGTIAEKNGSAVGILAGFVLIRVLWSIKFSLKSDLSVSS